MATTHLAVSVPPRSAVGGSVAAPSADLKPAAEPTVTEPTAAP